MDNELYKEYSFEGGVPVKKDLLITGRSSYLDYKISHNLTVIVSHDVFIEYNKGILLLKRANNPALGEWWCPGGRIERGVPAEDSLKRVAKRECGLSLHDIEYLTTARTFFRTDPFGHGAGTDTINLIYAAQGEGEIVLDSTHTEFRIMKKKDITSRFGRSLHPYIIYFLKAILDKRE